MYMQLLYFKENAVDILKKQDLSANIKYYYSDNNTWIAQKYSNQKFLLPFTKVEVPEFSLKMEHGIDDDYENMITMYENLKFLTDSQASDERLWSGMAHTIFWKYMQHRWPIPQKKEKRNRHILNNYFFWNSTKSVFLNGLSRLWWYARFTYDENLEDHYELTKYVCENDINGKIFPLLSCAFVNNKEVFKNIIKAIKKFEEDTNTKLTRDQFGELKKYLNRLSGKVFIDELNSEDIYNKICERIQIIQESTGWKSDVKSVIKSIPGEEFTIEDVYLYEDQLQKLHPDNSHVRNKIRQQLQFLRDDGFIEFIDKGVYRKNN